MSKAVQDAREGKGPSIVECKTYRHHGHNGSDNCAYRPAGELEEWKKKDPLKVFLERGYLTEEEQKEIETRTDLELEEACRFAAESPYPDASELMTDIFVD